MYCGVLLLTLVCASAVIARDVPDYRHRPVIRPVLRDPARTIGPIVIGPGPKPAVPEQHKIGTGAVPMTYRPIASGPVKVEATTAKIAHDPSRTIGPIVIMPGTARPKPAHDPSRTIGPIVISAGPKN